MRSWILLGGLVLVALPACRRPPPMATSTPPPPAKTSEPEAEEEQQTEEPAPAPPPPPTKPTSPAPAGEAGFQFGLSRKESFSLCTSKATWRRDGQNYACSAVVESPGFDGAPVLSFCSDKLCAIGIAVTPAAPDYQTWDQTFIKMRDALVAKHGEPTTLSDKIPDDCRNEKFQECLTSGKAERELTWTWDAHVVSLRMSKKKSGDGSPAIRFISRQVASATPPAQ
jgi:hypothetical protein